VCGILTVGAVQVTYGETGMRDEQFEFDSEALGGHVYFACFATRKMARFLDMVKENNVVQDDTLVRANSSRILG
jgi:hypothetical protein